MTLDQTVLHGIHAALTGPFLDFLMPKITALGNGGAIWEDWRWASWWGTWP